MKNRAYSLLHIKAFDDEKRTIKGIATTPEPDRVGDIVEPMGVEFKNPAPLLWMHNHDLPVGTVNFGEPTKDGVPFEATIATVENPAGLRARLDEAWESVKAGLVRAVSIGFRALEWSIVEDTGGYRFTKTELLELSLVTVPANREATISTIKSLDAEARAALGNDKLAKRDACSGVSGKKTVKLTPKEGNKMNISEQIKSFQNERAAKVAEMEDIMKKSTDAGETLAEDDAEKYDTLQDEVSKIDKHLSRLNDLQKMQIEKATPIESKKVSTEKAAAEYRAPATIKVKRKSEPGVDFARLARCKALSRLDNVPAYDIARASYGEDSEVYGYLKTAVAAGNTTNSTWAGPLVGDETTMFADFVEYLRPMTILGRMGTGGVPGPTRVPFRARLITQTTGGAGYWVGEGNAKPLTKFDFTGTTLEPLKVANIAVVSMELLRDSSPSAELLVRNGLAAALAERLDIDFVNPGKFPEANISPASITFGVPTIPSSGTDADAVRCDLSKLLEAFAEANNPPNSGVIIMSTKMAIALMTMRNPLGQREFPDVTMSGGILEGFPVIASQYLSTFGDSTGEFVFMVNASDIYLGDEGGVNVDMSDQASLQMDNDPDNPTTSSTVLVSLWQRNLVGFRAERTINWAKRRASAVAVLEAVNWTSCVTS